MVDIDDYKLQMTNSSIHSLNYANKVLWALFMILFIVLANSSMDLFMINLFLLVILAWSNISFRVILKNISFFGVLIFLLCFLISLVFLDLYLGIFFLLKIVDIVVTLSIIGITTSFYDLVRGARLLLKPFGFIGIVNKMSIIIGSSLKFMSIIYSERERIEVSKKLRGVKFNKMGFVDKIDLVLNELFIVLKFSKNKIDKLKSNIYINKYGIDSLKYNYRLNKWTKADTILLIINFLMLFIVLVY